MTCFMCFQSYDAVFSPVHICTARSLSTYLALLQLVIDFRRGINTSLFNSFSCFYCWFCGDGRNKCVLSLSRSHLLGARWLRAAQPPFNMAHSFIENINYSLSDLWDSGSTNKHAPAAAGPPTAMSSRPCYKSKYRAIVLSVATSQRVLLYQFKMQRKLRHHLYDNGHDLSVP